MMLGHVSLGIRDVEVSARFYDAVLGALGYVRLWTSDYGLGYGSPGGAEKLNLFQVVDHRIPGPGFHLAFVAPTTKAVDAFYVAALTYGGKGAGEPGPRPQYGATYYATFVQDPDGHKIEAVHQ